MRKVMANKSSAAVSSWGFSGYIVVLPKKKDKLATEATMKQESLPPKTPHEIEGTDPTMVRVRDRGI